MKKYFCAVLLVLCTALAGCGGKEIPGTPNPMGLSGKHSPEAETLFARARILWNKDDTCLDPEQALLLLDKALDLDTDYADAYQRRGLAKNALRDWDGAFDDLSRAIRLAPNAENFAFRALASLRGGNYMGARKDIDRSLGITSRQHRAWMYRGTLNMLEGDLQTACKDYNKACDYGDCRGLTDAREAGHCLK